MPPKVLAHAAQQETVDVAPPGETVKRLGSAFFRGETCNFNPYGRDHCNTDFAMRFLLKGWLPEQRFISRDTRITAFGSCFAENISTYLAGLGFDLSKQRDDSIYVSAMGEGLVNVHSILQQFKWALESWEPPGNLWHDYDAMELGFDEAVRRRTRDVFLSTEVFILTCGLSEIWYDEISGGVLWRAVPMRHYDPQRHKFRVCSFAETSAALNAIVDLVGKHVPRAKVVLTVSPIPLIATFRPVACMTANSASKAILRAALDEMMRTRPAEGSLFYFPAYEIVTAAFPNRHVDDGRHLQPMVVPAIMKLFEAAFCGTPLTMEQAERDFREARLQNVATLRSHPFYGASADL